MYAFAVGFSVVIVSSARTTSRKRNREVIRVTMKCNKYGNNTTKEKEQMVLQRQNVSGYSYRSTHHENSDIQTPYTKNYTGGKIYFRSTKYNNKTYITNTYFKAGDT